MNKSASIEWKWGTLAAIAVLLLAIYPQLNMWLARGGNWHGSYVVIQGDEVAYSAYINALVDGRPRRNDPASGRDDAPNAPLPESLFSIQFVPAYAVALPARALGLSTSTAFIVLLFIAAIASTLAIFWLIFNATGDSRLAACGAIVALCLGTMVSTQGEVRAFLGSPPTYDFFPYLRRYQPSFVFPLFFVLCALAYRALKAERQKSAIMWAVGAGVVFASLVFSYFYFWTAAAAWLASLALCWLIFRREAWRRIILVFGITGAIAVVAFVPYMMMLSHRAQDMDNVQLLSLSHAPDLFRVCEIIGFVILAGLAVGARRGLVAWKDQAVLLTASLALMPFFVFNQQVITGRSIQPIHYEIFIANYAVLIAAMLLLFLMWRGKQETARVIPSRVLAMIALLAFGWGIIEATGATKRDVDVARVRDDAMPALARLKEMSRNDALQSGARDPRPVVFSTNPPVADVLSTVTPQALLWAHHMNAFPGVNSAERKERFYQYMYYSGIGEKELAQAIAEVRFGIMAELFGLERVIPGLTPDAKPVTLDEARAELRRYSEYINSFTRERAMQPALSYVITPTEAQPDWTNLDRWYERDRGEQVGVFTIYRVKLRS